MNSSVNTAGLTVFTGNANRPLAQAVCTELGVPLGKALVGRFSDGEVQVEIEENVRRQEVFVIQPTCAPSAENLIELLVLIDALKRASAASVTAVVPYFGYARQDRRPRSARVPITAKVAAKMIASGRHRPRADRRPARRPDPGLLRHAGRQRLRLAGAAGRHLAQPRHGRPDRGLAPTSAAWCARARSPSASTTPTSRSSTSAARGRTWRR